MDLCWDAIDESDWAARAPGPLPLQQSWRYGAVAAMLGARVGRAVISDGARDLAMAQVLARRGLRVVSRGPVWLDCDDPGQRRAVLRRLARLPGPVVATPDAALAGFGLIPLVTPRHHAIWDLRPDPAHLRAALAPKWRATLRLAEGADPVLTRSDRWLQPALARGAEQARVRGYRGLPDAFARAWAGAGQAHLIAWCPGGQMQAAILMLQHGQGASYHLGWASDTGRAAHVHWAMLWRMALWLRDRGVTSLDLGDVDTEGAPGLARFKLGTGAALHRLGATCLVLPG